MDKQRDLYQIYHNVFLFGGGGYAVPGRMPDSEAKNDQYIVLTRGIWN